MHAPPPIAENLARIRKIRDISQVDLARESGVGVDTISRIERGERHNTRPATVAKLAKVLRVKPEALLGLPPVPEPAQASRIADLRQAITTNAEIPGLGDFADTEEVATPQDLAATAHQAWRAYVDGQHSELLYALPILLVDTQRLVHSTSGDDNAIAHRLLSTAYRLGAGLAGRFDLDDLAWTAAERALSAAQRSDAAEIETTVSLRYLVWTLVRQGRLAEAERVAVAAAEKIEPRMLDRDPARAGAFGNMLFNAATAAQRAGSAGRADDLLAVAESAAVRAGRDTATEAAIFGPRVAAFQRVDQTVRAGDPETALRLADRVPDPRGEVPAFWEAGHRLHLAAAAVDVRQDQLALGFLTEARDLAPDWVRRQPLGVSTMRQLVDRATRRRGATFALLAAHYGVVDAED